MQVTYSGDSDAHTPISLLLLGPQVDDYGRTRGPLFRVLEDVEYTVDEAPAGLRRFTVPGGSEKVGFRYDRATMPLITRAFIDRDMLDSAALAHDFALKCLLGPDVTRKDCDLLFLEVARLTEYLSKEDRQLAYYAVRLNSIWQDLKKAVGMKADTTQR